MARHGENIRKRKDGRWEGRYIKGRTPDGKAKLGYVYGKTYGQVRQRLVQGTMRRAHPFGRKPDLWPVGAGLAELFGQQRKR